MGRRVTVDHDLCIGSGNCEFRAPNTFEVGDDALSHVIDPDGDDEETVDLAVMECPTAAIAATG